MFRTLVFGASLHSYRYSYLAMKRLKAKDFDVVGIGGTAGEIDGMKILTGHPPLENIHTISMYIDPDKQAPHIEYLLSLRPKRIIFNPGAENHSFAALAREKGIVVEYACTLVMLSLGTYAQAA